ncbi:hypothetical protein MY10362_008078 [Beauveria mimosiformis]
MSYGGDYSDNSQKGADTILGAMSRDLGTAVECVMGTVEAGWTVTCESARRRYEEGLALAMKSNMAGFVKMLYDLGEATKDAITLAEMLRQRAERMANWGGYVVSDIVIHNELGGRENGPQRADGHGGGGDGRFW